MGSRVRYGRVCACVMCVCVTGMAGPFETFFVTNSNPTVTDRLPKDDVFMVRLPSARPVFDQR